jgi:hypothetical protein
VIRSLGATSVSPACERVEKNAARA